uniref:AF4/FMR2 C-terminal homology domain-containing protein n=1 Tax=Meloidogyne javanica TaxID=6303 RepID=A0A915N438_MELJA
MIGQLVNISKPLSPVTFAQNESNQLANGFEATKEDEFSNKSEKFGPDLDTILEQISRVSPLLSPIVNISTSLNENNSDSLDNLKQEINAVITSKNDQNGSKNNLKRPNSDEDTSHIHISPKRHKDLHVEEHHQQQYFTQNNIKKENNTSIYSIKLRSISLNKLLNKFYPQKELQEEGELQQEIQSERSVDCSTANASTPTTQIDVEHTQNEGGNGQQSDNMSDQPANISDCDFKIGFPTPDGKSPPFDFFQKNARDIRKRSDQEGDRILKLLFSFESLAYYIMASSTLTSKTEKMHSSIAENTNYLNSSWNSFKKQKITESKFLTSIRTRLKYLQMMISACLAYNLYSLPLTTNGIGGAATCSTTTPSPGSSTPSSFNSQTTVTLPLEMYNIMVQQVKIHNHLMWSDKLWNDAESHAPQECKEFFERVTNLCCELKPTSGLSTIAEFLLTTVQCLKKEYGDKT